MKSAYEKALEKLEKAGIEGPNREALTDEQRERMAEIRSRAEAELAQLDILAKSKLAAVGDPTEREQVLQELAADRERIEHRRDRDLEKVRAGD